MVAAVFLVKVMTNEKCTPDIFACQTYNNVAETDFFGSCRPDKAFILRPFLYGGALLFSCLGALLTIWRQPKVRNLMITSHRSHAVGGCSQIRRTRSLLISPSHRLMNACHCWYHGFAFRDWRSQRIVQTDSGHGTKIYASAAGGPNE